jgi:hypothetical protein
VHDADVNLTLAEIPSLVRQISISRGDIIFTNQLARRKKPGH